MPHVYTPHSYPPSYYDDHMSLKPPLLLWLVVVYLSRAIVLPAIMGIGAFAGVNSDAIGLFRQFCSAETLLPSLLACIILLALFRRAPNASKPVCWIWAHGRTLLALSAGLDLAISLILPIRQREIDPQVLLSLCGAGIDAFLLAYILVARRVCDAFADFPLPLERPARSR